MPTALRGHGDACNVAMTLPTYTCPREARGHGTRPHFPHHLPHPRLVLRICPQIRVLVFPVPLTCLQVSVLTFPVPLTCLQVSVLTFPVPLTCLQVSVLTFFVLRTCLQVSALTFFVLRTCPQVHALRCVKRTDLQGKVSGTRSCAADLSSGQCSWRWEDTDLQGKVSGTRLLRWSVGSPNRPLKSQD